MNGTGVTKEAKVAEFLNSPLVKWIRTFEDLAPCDSMASLADAELLTKIMQEADPSSVSLAKINRKVGGDRMRRAQNLHYLLESIMNYYASTLEQVVVMRLPDLLAICKDPENDESLYELEKLLLLLLGCTVQCQNKEVMIQQIQRLGTSVQHAVVTHIKEVTDNPDVVFAFDWEDIEAMTKAQLEAECRRMYLYLQKLAKERDEYHLARIDLSHERDFYLEQYSLAANVKQTLSRTPSFLKSPPQQGDMDSQHMRELKKKVRTQQEQLDSKSSQLQEVQEELDKYKEQVQRLHQEKRQLSKDAQKVRVYKDEVEVLRAKVTDFDQLQAENKKLKDKVEDVDYLKKKLQEFKEQNSLMLESKQILEEEIASMTAKYQAIDEKNSEIAKLKMQIDSLQTAKDSDLQQIQELIEMNARLEFEKRHTEEDLASLRKELEELKAKMVSGGDGKPSFGSELTEEEMSARTKLLRLERDNKRLEKMMDDLKESSAKVAAYEVANKDLSSQCQQKRKEVIQLQEELRVEQLKSERLEEENTKLHDNFDRLGIDHEKTVAGIKLKEREKFGEIEARIDAALNRSMGFDEERMTVLESRLEESTETNKLLSETVEKLQRENAKLKTAVPLSSGPPGNVGGDSSSGGGAGTALLGSTSSSSGTGIGTGGSSGGVVNAESIGSLSGTSSRDGSHETSPAVERRWTGDHMTLMSPGGSSESPRFHHGRRSDPRIPQFHQQSGSGASSPMLVSFREGLAARDFAYLQDKILDLRGEKAGLEGEVTELKSRMTRLEQAKSEIEMKRKAEVTTKDAEIRSLQRQIQDLEIFRVEVEIRRNEVSQLNRELAQLRRRMHEAESARTELEVRQHSVSSAKLAEVKALRRQIDEICQINHELETIQDTLTEKCTMLDQMNKTLEQENKHLLAQLSSLVIQNRDLMARNIESNDKFHVGEKQFNERLADLVSEKEKLRGKLEALEAEKNKKKKGFFSRMKGKFKGKHSKSEDKTSSAAASTTTDGGGTNVSTSESTSSLGSKAISFGALPDALLVQQPQGTRSSLAYGQTTVDGRRFEDDLGSPTGDARSRYSIATARPSSDRNAPLGYSSDRVLALEDFLKETNRTPNSRKRYIEEMLATLQTPYRNEKDDQQLYPRRDLSPGESPPSFLKTPPKQRNNSSASASTSSSTISGVARRVSSPPTTSGGGGGGSTTQGSDASVVSAPIAPDRPKARRRMQSTDALLGGRSSFTPPRLEPVSVSDDDTSSGDPTAKRIIETRERRRRARTVDSSQWAELKSPTRKSAGSGVMAPSQERQPSDGAPADESSSGGNSEKQRPDGGSESPMHRSLARATLTTTPKVAFIRHPGLSRTRSDPRRRSGGSSDTESGAAPRKNNSNQSAGGGRVQSPVGGSSGQPVFQSTPLRSTGARPTSSDVASSGDEDVLRSPVGDQKENNEPAAKNQVMSPTKSESGMDNSGWYEYGCV